jgi:hypothetical protein
MSRGRGRLLSKYRIAPERSSIAFTGRVKIKDRQDNAVIAYGADRG